MPVIALLLLVWALFGCAVVVMMIYGAFEHVAMNDAVMAAVLATGTAFLASLSTFLSWRRSGRWAGDRPCLVRDAARAFCVKKVCPRASTNFVVECRERSNFAAGPPLCGG